MISKVGEAVPEAISSEKPLRILQLGAEPEPYLREFELMEPEAIAIVIGHLRSTGLSSVAASVASPESRRPPTRLRLPPRSRLFRNLADVPR